MKYSSILIITYGRSGSTLLQGILNSIEGCVIRGENYNFIYSLFHSYKCILAAKRYGIHPSDPNDAWYGAHLLDEKIFIEYVKALLKKLIIADKLDSNIVAYGFKEIRYTQVPDFSAYLDFLKKVFPKVAFIFNTRNLDNVVKSGWWVDQDPIKTKSILSGLEEKFRNYQSKGNNAFLIDYEDVITKSDNLFKLYEFLGAEYNSDRIDEILNTPHSYNPTQERVQKLFAGNTHTREPNKEMSQNANVRYDFSRLNYYRK